MTEMRKQPKIRTRAGDRFAFWNPRGAAQKTGTRPFVPVGSIFGGNDMAEDRMDETNGQSGKPERQAWKPNWFLQLLYRIWRIAFGAAKIAAGAAATVAMIAIICCLVFAGILGDYLQNDILPEAGVQLSTSEIDAPSTMYYVDANGEIQVLQDINAEVSQEWASFDELPEDLIHAAVAIEDKRFFEHQGVDWVTTIKACARMFVGDGSMGGSTITQQMIKNYTQRDDVTVQRKVQEIFDATRCEKQYDKKMIMEYYMNLIYLGEGQQGVKSAAAYYFGKELQMLTTAECASLISITNNPSIFNPYAETFSYYGVEMTGVERNKLRQKNVLDEMLSQGWLTQSEYDAAIAQELVFKSGIPVEERWAKCLNAECGYQGQVMTLTHDGERYSCPNCGTEIPVTTNASQDIYSWYVDAALEEAAAMLAELDGVEFDPEDKAMRQTYIGNRIQKGGLSIYTAYNAEVQAAVDRIYGDLAEIPETYSDQQFQSSMVVVDNRTGDIAAMVGGVGEKKYFDQFSRATDSRLQTGSSIKPISVYAPAFEAGLSPATVIEDLPYSEEGGAYPLNDDYRYSFRRTILSAVIDSVNAVAMRTLDRIGVDYSYSFAKDKFGLKSLIDGYTDDDGTVHSDIALAPLSLGAQTNGVSVREMSSAFATFANNGVYREGRLVTKIYDRNGNLVATNDQESRTILSEKSVNYMNYCLAEAVRIGTGDGAYLYSTQVCGKTGSTDGYKDRWFCGFTKYYTAAVWTGYDTPESIEIVGAWYNPACRLWKKVMEPLHEGKAYEELYSTSGMSWVTVCKDSGGFANDACAYDVRGAITGYNPLLSAPCYPEDISGGMCDKHILVDYCTTGGGVATEYCRKFAAAGESVVIEKKALVKMTQEELDTIRRLSYYGLYADYTRDDYIYLVYSDGTDNNSYTGVSGNVNQNVSAPYLVCPAHTRAAWEAYEKAQAATTPPTNPVLPPSGGTTVTP